MLSLCEPHPPPCFLLSIESMNEPFIGPRGVCLVSELIKQLTKENYSLCGKLSHCAICIFIWFAAKLQGLQATNRFLVAAKEKAHMISPTSCYTVI